MASVNFSEKEYGAVAGAASDALRHRDMDDARTLNELASKMNKALTTAKFPGNSGLSGKRKFQAPGPIDEQLGIKR